MKFKDNYGNEIECSTSEYLELSGGFFWGQSGKMSSPMGVDNGDEETSFLLPSAFKKKNRRAKKCVVDMIKIKCHLCKYLWEYRGDKAYATCPQCHRKVNVEKHQTESAISGNKRFDRKEWKLLIRKLREKIKQRLRTSICGCQEKF